jgi:hypothetical protein
VFALRLKSREGIGQVFYGALHVLLGQGMASLQFALGLARF